MRVDAQRRNRNNIQKLAIPIKCRLKCRAIERTRADDVADVAGILPAVYKSLFRPGFYSESCVPPPLPPLADAEYNATRVARDSEGGWTRDDA